MPRTKEAGAEPVRLLAATRRGQGQRRDDVFDCVDGELVRPAVCGRYESCTRCDRRFAGIASGGLTSTAVLVEVPITRGQLLGIVAGYAEQLHWHDVDLDGLADELLGLGGQGCPTGTVVGRNGDTVTARR